MAGVLLSYVDDLNARRDIWNMKARVIKVWRQSYRWDFIVVDERGAKIQGVVKNHLTPQFEGVLKEDAVILIKKFGVAAQNDSHRVIALNHKINLFKVTELEPISTWSAHPYFFRFIPFPDVHANKLNGALTVDVIGRVTSCGNLEVFKSATKESRRFNFDLQDIDGNDLKCTFWGEYADQCNSFFSANTSPEIVIVAIQHGRRKEWSGVTTVQNDMFATRIFLNEELDEANDLRRRMIVKDGPSTSLTVLSSQTSYPMRAEFVEKTPRIHVEELIDVQKVSTYVVVATVSMLEEEFGWFYKAHRHCNRKVYTKTEYLEHAKVIPDNFIDAPVDSLWCYECSCLAESLVPKFKVQMRVQDTTGSVSFIMFDKDVQKVVGLTASQVRDRQLSRGDLEQFPMELHVLQNKVLAFKMIVSKYNLNKRSNAYTIGKVCDDDEVIQELQGRDAVEVVSPDGVDANVVCLDDSSQLGIDSKDATSYTGSSLAAEPEKDSAQSPGVKRPLPIVSDDKNLDEGSAVKASKKKLNP